MGWGKENLINRKGLQLREGWMGWEIDEKMNGKGLLEPKI